LKLVESLKDCENLVVLESVYWQWTTYFMISHNYAHDDVIAINSSLDDIISPLAPKLVYYAHADVESHIKWIFNTRGGKWANDIIERDMQFPYHQSRDHIGLNGLIKFFEECQSNTDELFNLTQIKKVQIHNPHEAWDETYSVIVAFIREGL